MTTLRVDPPAEDGFTKSETILDEAARTGLPTAEPQTEKGPDFLKLVAEAESQGNQFIQDNHKGSWDRSYRAFHNEHFSGSKYHSAEFKGRSKLFRPKTRAAVRKDNAAAAAALFSTTDSVKCSPGNEGDPIQRASAALIQELLNYRTDRTSGMAAMPWFRIAIGARQDTYIMGNCLSKQYWKLELKRQVITEKMIGPDGTPVLDGATGEPVTQQVVEYSPKIDRPDCLLIPLENAIIDPAADWLDPIQSAAYFIAKFPMRIDEIREKEKHPLQPWHHLAEPVLRGAATDNRMRASGTRAARESGFDRMDSSATGTGAFEVIWVYEVFMKVGGEDVCFYSAGSKAYLTDPKPVEEVYPALGGERPYVLGTGTLESHRVLPMAPAEALQPLQQEINDLANLRLDQVKQTVSPITFVKRGRQVDLGALQRRGPNSVILRTAEDDVEFDRPPEVPSSAYAEMERLNADYDDMAGQFNSGSVQTNRSLNETVGGLNLIAGAANTLQEFDLRTWVETWVEPVLGQITKIIQYYESDETILALCGEKAKLLQKFGVNQITDELLQKQITVRVDVGLGASNPQSRLQRFAGATQILTPIWQASPQVQSGEFAPNIEEITNEVYSGAGYRDGGSRFITKGPPKGAPPEKQAMLRKIIAEASQKESAARLNDAKAVQTKTGTQIDVANTVHQQQMDRAQMVNQVRNERENAQRTDRNDRIAQENVTADRDQRDRQFASSQEGASQPAPEAAPQEEEPETDARWIAKQLVGALLNPPEKTFEFIRDPKTNQIIAAREVSAQKPTPEGAR